MIGVEKHIRAILIASALIIAHALPATAKEATHLQLDTGGHMALVMGMEFTPDGKQLVTASNDKTIRVWNLETGKTERTIRGHISPGTEGRIYTMALSPNGKWLAVAGFMSPGFGVRDDDVGDIRLYDFATGKLVKRLKGHGGVVQCLAFSPDSRLLVSGSGLGDLSAIVWDVERHSEIRRLKGHRREVYAIAFTPDGQRIVTGSFDGELRLWRASDGGLIKRMVAHQDAVRSLAVSPKDGMIAAASNDGEVLFFDGTTGEFIRRFIKHTTDATSLTFSGDGRYLIFGPGAHGYDREVLVLDVWSGEVIHAYDAHDNIVVASAVSPDGRWVASAGGSRFQIHVWDMRTGERRKGSDGKPLDLTGVGIATWSVAIDDSGRNVAWGGTSERIDPIDRGPLELALTLPSAERNLGAPKPLQGAVKGFKRARAEAAGLTLRCRDGSTCPTDSTLVIKRNGKTIGEIPRESWSGYDHRAYTIAPDGKTIVSGGSNGVLETYTPDGKQIRQFIGHRGDIWAVVVTPDGKTLISGSADQTVRFWNINTGELVVTLFQGTNGDWVMWTPQGYYTASTGGDDLVGWHINRGPDQTAEYVRASQLKKHFYRPEIIERALHLVSAKKAIAEAEDKDFSIEELETRRPPLFKILSPEPDVEHDDKTVKVEVAVQDTEDPLDKIEVMVNGRQITGRAAVTLEEKQGTHSFNVPLSSGDNVIRITAFNAVGKTVREVKVIHRGRGSLDKRGTLYMVAIGVDEYPKIEQDLAFAGADAKAFHDTIVKTVGPLHSDVKTLLLTNENAKDPKKKRYIPTADNIEDVLDFFSDSKPEDTVILFLAGHGINDGSNYFFLPTDAEQKDGRWRKSSVVKWTDLETAINDARGRRIMFVDTCHSGKAYNQRLLKDASDANIVVFSATDSQTLAQENTDLGHGVFTHSILKALGGAADFMRDGHINLLELGFYVSNEVKRITDRAQEPVFHLSGAKDFVFARM